MSTTRRNRPKMLGAHVPQRASRADRRGLYVFARQFNQAFTAWENKAVVGRVVRRAAT